MEDTNGKIAGLRLNEMNAGYQGYPKMDIRWT